MDLRRRSQRRQRTPPFRLPVGGDDRVRRRTVRLVRPAATKTRRVRRYSSSSCSTAAAAALRFAFAVVAFVFVAPSGGFPSSCAASVASAFVPPPPDAVGRSTSSSAIVRGGGGGGGRRRRSGTVASSAAAASRGEEGGRRRRGGKRTDASSLSSSSKLPLLFRPADAIRSAKLQYDRRVSADPNFPQKSIVEICLAAGTQFVAEWSRRGGAPGVVDEIDFVVAGVLTAIAGKYYGMWRVAPTASSSVDDDGNDRGGGGTTNEESSKSKNFWTDVVPTNAFQSHLLDGVTPVTLRLRFCALLAPIPSLFRAGMIASAVGYGLTSVLVSLRTKFVPSYVAKTVDVNVFHACLFTGAFLAIASNLRYQILSGLIEPKVIDIWFGKHPKATATATFFVRLGNGLFGSVLSIAGMRYFGLQKLKA